MIKLDSPERYTIWSQWRGELFVKLANEEQNTKAWTQLWTLVGSTLAPAPARMEYGELSKETGPLTAGKSGVCSDLEQTFRDEPVGDMSSRSIDAATWRARMLARGRKPKDSHGPDSKSGQTCSGDDDVEGGISNASGSPPLPRSPLLDGPRAVDGRASPFSSDSQLRVTCIPVDCNTSTSSQVSALAARPARRSLTSRIKEASEIEGDALGCGRRMNQDPFAAIESMESFDIPILQGLITPAERSLSEGNPHSAPSTQPAQPLEKPDSDHASNDPEEFLPTMAPPPPPSFSASTASIATGGTGSPMTISPARMFKKPPPTGPRNRNLKIPTTRPNGLFGSALSQVTQREAELKEILTRKRKAQSPARNDCPSAQDLTSTERDGDGQEPSSKRFRGKEPCDGPYELLTGQPPRTPLGSVSPRSWSRPPSAMAIGAIVSGNTGFGLNRATAMTGGRKITPMIQRETLELLSGDLGEIEGSGKGI